MDDMLRKYLLTEYPHGMCDGELYSGHAHEKALSLYKRSQTTAFLQDLWMSITGEPNYLISLPEMYGETNFNDLGYQTIEIDKIIGSEKRNDDYDQSFRPLKTTRQDSWVRTAIEVLLGNKVESVELVQADGTFYVRDGHELVSVMRSLGYQYMNAHVYHLEIPIHLWEKSHSINKVVNEFNIVDI